MGLIHVLDDLVANQIAAGEVVERPAAVIKELIENAIDADAKTIQVLARDGGLTLLEVQDDGMGIAQDDVEIAFLRHATSKLSHLTDLNKIHSLGFRGEALPSIAAVSKVTLRTRMGQVEEGVLVCYQGGHLVERTPVGCPQGTRITVEDLFYNTPARLKFVRSLQTENTHIVEIVSRAAMARPDISFRVQIDDRVVFSTAGDGALISAFAAIHSLNLSKSALALLLESPDYVVAGLVVAPEFARKSRNAMWFSVNGRPIRSIALGNAVLEGYETLVPKGRFPVVTVALSMNPTLVDVNVHPSKMEVRFSEERDVCALVASAVKQTLQMGVASPTVSNLSKHTPSRELIVPVQETREEAASWKRSGVEAPVVPTERGQRGVHVAEGTTRGRGRGLLGSVISSSYSNTGSNEETTQVALDLFKNQGQEVVKSDHSVPGLRAIAQVLKLVIVAEDGEDIYLIDQHAAHERVLYEQFRAKIHARENYPFELLVPVTVQLNAVQTQAVMQHQRTTAVFGFVFELFGDDVIRITHVPSIWEGLDIPQLTHDVIFDLLADRPASAFRVELENKVILRACKAAIKANSTMNQMEMDALLEEMQKLENPFTCPHGRPTAIRITRSQLEREFKRRL